MKNASRLERMYAVIDAVNALDPAMAEEAGAPVPQAVLYGRRMTSMLKRLRPDAGELLCIAARAQHIERWSIPRQSYPEGRIGYLSWRKELQKHHARKAGALMAAEGYGQEDIERVGRLLRKEHLKHDADMQTLEDVACLMFLEHEAPAFIARHDDEKIVSILSRTARKMSSRGIAAIAMLTLDARLQRLLTEATATGGPSGP